MPFVLLLLACLLHLPALAQNLEVEPHQIIPEAADHAVFDKLRLLSAVRLSRPDDPDFGGFSGLWIAPTGEEMVAISDRGYWYRWGLSHTPDGRLNALEVTGKGPLLDFDGKPLEEQDWADAESLTRLEDGSFLIGFEREHRLWHYDSLERAPLPFDLPGDFDSPHNEGLEALELLADGRLIAFSEGQRSPVSEGGDWRAWLHDGRGWLGFSYMRSDALQPTGAGLLPNGDVILVERFFSVVGGLHIRIARLSAGDLQPGALVEGEELASFREPPRDVDNFEAIAAREGPGGQTLIYLLADDNFNAPLQESLLFVFQVRP